MINQSVVVFGKRSNLTKSLVKSLSANDKILKVISTQDILASKVDWEALNNSTFIFNNFFPAKNISSINKKNLSISVDYAIKSTTIALDSIKKHNLKVKKIIYTSSSSVYAEINQNTEVNPKNLFAMFKRLNESFISSYCNQNNIDFTIARVFNIYGGNDNFSVISKLIKYKPGQIFNITNSGSSKRDFIHIDDVSYILSKLVDLPNTHFVDIGTGSSLSVCEIIDFLESNNFPINIKNTSIEENPFSVANMSLLHPIIGNDFRFKSVFEFLRNNLLN